MRTKGASNMAWATDAELAGQRRLVWMKSVAVMGLTLLPYLYGAFLVEKQPSKEFYSWFTFMVADHCGYLSWMRQAADGHFFQQNLFTTEQQSGLQFNLFFLALGNIARFMQLPLIFVYHVARIVSGIIFLRVAWWILELLISDYKVRRVGFMLICLSAGLGWVPGLWERYTNGPVDIWQPEAITFLSLYLFPLLNVSLLLMIGSLGWLLVADRTRRYRHAVYAGACGFLLGNIHSYDVITVTGIWGGYLIIRSILKWRIESEPWIRALTAGGLTSISTCYMGYLLLTDNLLAERVTAPMHSPPFWMYLLGFGFIFVLAIVGAIGPSGRASFQQFGARGCNRLSGEDSEVRIGVATSHPCCLDFHSRLFLIIWAIVNISVAYLPVWFQRKMLMGAHIPLCILAGVALTTILRPLGKRTWKLIFGVMVLFLALTNLRFVVRNMDDLPRIQDKMRAYMYSGEVSALKWVRDKLPAGVPVQPLPWVTPDPQTGQFVFLDATVASFTPGLTGHPVHAGHWGETPSFAKNMSLWAKFLHPDTPDEWRRNLLRMTGIRYLIFTQKHNETGDRMLEKFLFDLFRTKLSAYLRHIPEASNVDADVYEFVE